MAKRQKHVFDTGEVPHLWMHRTQDDARNRQGNLYFTGGTIYSYGSHFPIACHVANDAGERAVLFTTASYSVTTSGHCSAVHSAIPSGIPVFHVPNVNHGRYSDELTAEDHAANLADYTQRIEAQVITSARARSSWRKESAHESAQSLRAEAIAYAAFFGLPTPQIAEIPELDSDALAAVKAREAKRAAEKAEQTKRERAEAIARQAQLIEQWRAGQYSGCLYDVPTMLRIDGNEVVTSRGGTFPCIARETRSGSGPEGSRIRASLRPQRTHHPPRPICH